MRGSPLPSAFQLGSARESTSRSGEGGERGQGISSQAPSLPGHQGCVLQLKVTAPVQGPSAWLPASVSRLQKLLPHPDLGVVTALEFLVLHHPRGVPTPCPPLRKQSLIKFSSNNDSEYTPISCWDPDTVEHLCSVCRDKRVMSLVNGF